jgi:hypothetical protein
MRDCYSDWRSGGACWYREEKGIFGMNMVPAHAPCAPPVFIVTLVIGVCESDSNSECPTELVILVLYTIAELHTC